MKKSICFAGFSGDEASALQAVTKTQAIWECRFVPDAAATLALLSGDPCDVCVASMAMPGKNGAELLGEVSRLYPQTLGVLVGNAADQALILGSLAGPHQFIRRPFGSANLVAVVQNGLKLAAWLPNEELRKLTPRLRRLPSLSAAHFNLMKEMDSPANTLEDIGDAIGRDPELTGQLLHMIHSPAFSLAKEVNQPVDAVAALGIPTLKAMLLCLPVFEQSDAARDAGLSPETLWEHSFLVAKFARQITRKQTGDPRLADEAFTAGLLHDVGRIVLAANYPKEYAAVVASAREKSRPLLVEETAQLGVNHAQAGAFLLSGWGLPAPIVEVAAAHHAPGKTIFESKFTLLAAVHAANVFAHATSGQTEGLPLPELDLAYFRILKLEEQLVGWRLECTGELAMAPKIELEAKPIAVAAPPSIPSSTAPAQGFVPLWKFAVAGVVAVAAVIGAWPYLRSSIAPMRPPTTYNQPDDTTAPPSAPTNQDWEPPSYSTPHKTAPGPVTLDTMRVQGIFYRANKSMAIVNDQAVSIGDNIKGIYVVAIRPNSVTFSNNNVLKTSFINEEPAAPSK